MRVLYLAGLLVTSSIPGVSAEDQLGVLLLAIEGSYQTAEPDKLKKGENPMWDRRQRVDLAAMNATGIYWQLNTGDEKTVYRQRLLTYVPQEDGSVIQHTWSFKDPERMVDQFNNTALFAGLTEADLIATLDEGCEQVWRRHNEYWRGRVDPASCRIWSTRREEWRRIGAETRLYGNELWQVERGFDDDMNQLFGTAPGEYYILKQVDVTP